MTTPPDQRSWVAPSMPGASAPAPTQSAPATPAMPATVLGAGREGASAALFVLAPVPSRASAGVLAGTVPGHLAVPVRPGVPAAPAVTGGAHAVIRRLARSGSARPGGRSRATVRTPPPFFAPRPAGPSYRDVFGAGREGGPAGIPVAVLSGGSPR